jgi:hypothetical protein
LANLRTGIERDEQTSFLYESLRSHILENDRIRFKPSSGLALLVRRGMLALAETWHPFTPVGPTTGKQVEVSLVAYETKSEMTRILANMTLSNLKDA